MQCLIRIFIEGILDSHDAKLFHADNKDMDVHADLSLYWVHMSEGTFSHVVAYI